MILEISVTNKILQYLENKDKSIAKVYDKTYQIHTQIINDYESLYLNLSGKYGRLAEEKAEMGIIIEKLKNNLEKANLEKSAVLLIGEDMEKQVMETQEEVKSIKNQFIIQIKELKKKVEEMGKENNEIFDKLVAHAKERADNILVNKTPQNINKIKNLENKIAQKTENKKEAKIQGNLAKNNDFKLFNIGSAQRNDQLGNTNIRILTLKQLKDIIAEIYESKEKHDEK